MLDPVDRAMQTIPPRTKVDVLIPVAEIDVTTDDCIFNMRDRPEAIEFVCLDCGFKSKTALAMTSHQMNRSRYHTWSQWLHSFIWW